jgi:hypothetical protein
MPMLPRSVRVSKMVGVLLAALVSLCPVAGAFDARLYDPPPPDYGKIVGRSAVVRLATAKFEWLKQKKTNEERAIRSFKRQLPETNDSAAMQKDIDDLNKDIDTISKEIDELVAVDAFDPKTNAKAKANAKLVVDNAKAWSETLAAQAGTTANSDTTEAAKLGKNAKELENDIKAAAEENDLFK